MHKKVSIIVPVYNSAPYLKSCVASVLRQTYTDFELLLITDGPTDGSEEICRRLALKDQRIQFLPQTHKGVSVARNIGLEKASGEYLFFLDSDDAIHPQLLEKLTGLAKKTKAEIISENFCTVPSAHFERRVSRLSSSCELSYGEDYIYLDKEQALDYLMFDRPQGMLYAIGGKLIERTTAQKARFDEALLSGEDTKYMYQLLAEGVNVAVFNKKQYYYRRHRQSRSAERTVEACKSVYACDKYIWLQEKRKGRELYAQRQKEKIVRRLAAWHVAAHIKRNRILTQYTYRLVKKEMDSLTPGKMGWRTELEYWMAFYCYPAYQICCIILDFLYSIETKL